MQAGQGTCAFLCLASAPSPSRSQVSLLWWPKSCLGLARCGHIAIATGRGELRPAYPLSIHMNEWFCLSGLFNN